MTRGASHPRRQPRTAGPVANKTIDGEYLDKATAREPIGQTGYYPLAGSGQMADRLVEAIKARGGEVRLRQTVTRLHATNAAISGLTARAINGTERNFRCHAVVCNADLKVLSEQLLSGEPTLARALSRQTGALVPACSAVGVCLGLRGALDLPPVIHIDGPDGFAALVVPSAVDPTAAPPRYSTLEILRLLPFKGTGT